MQHLSMKKQEKSFWKVRMMPFTFDTFVIDNIYCQFNVALQAIKLFLAKFTMWQNKQACQATVNTALKVFKKLFVKLCVRRWSKTSNRAHL
jgi:hypothetical protein